jgi:SAM-dependent methyltransferase
MADDAGAELLHRGGTPGAWGNLGLWPGAADYATACRALAQRVGEAARLQPGDQLLSVACGAGEELRLWREHFGAHDLLGIEPDAALAAAARAHGRVLQQDALAPLKGRFDAVLCVDAAYHFTPRQAWLHAMAQRLRPGSRIAFTDLVLDSRPSAPLRRAAAWCGVDADDLMLLPVAVAFLRELRLHDSVLGLEQPVPVRVCPLVAYRRIGPPRRHADVELLAAVQLAYASIDVLVDALLG